MPLTTIDLHAGTTTPEQRKAISDGIHSAMIEVLGIPADDRFHVFHELPAGSMFHEDIVFGLPRTNHLMFVTLSFNHRAAEQKDALYATLVRRLGEHAGITPEDVVIRVLETASENWWARGRTVNPDTGYDQRMTTPSSNTP
jgi:phenylpyruvate tautomerase PptA (4-oxalocrotonate tautomerase family)